MSAIAIPRLSFPVAEPDAEEESDFNQIESLLSRYDDILRLPHMLTLVHSVLEPNGLSTEDSLRYPILLTTLARFYHLSEKLLSLLLDQSLAHVNEPQLLFRTDNMNTRFFREYISQIMTPMLLQNSLLKLTLRSLSQEHLSAGQLSAAATDLLIILEEMHLPYELTWFCAIVSSFVAKKFPGFERFGVAGLFFLRYLSPLILQFFSTYDRDAECNSKIYQRNSLIVVKLIQTMANGTAEAMTANRNDVFFSKANFDRMQAFLAKTAHKDHPQLPLTFPNVIPAPSEFDEFFQLVMRHASLIHKAIRSHGATVYELLEQPWVHLTIEWSRVAEKMYHLSPRSLHDFIYPSLVTEDDPVVSFSLSPKLMSNRKDTHSAPASVRRLASPTSREALPAFKAQTMSRAFSPKKGRRLTISNVLSVGKSRSTPAEPARSFSGPWLISSSTHFDSSSCSSVSTLMESTGQVPIDIYLKSVQIMDPSPELRISPSLAHISTWDDSMVLKWLQINQLKEMIPPFEEQNISGLDLAQAAFRPLKVHPCVQERFLFAYDQLQLNALDVFNASLFRSSEEHILALQAEVVKLRMMLQR